MQTLEQLKLVACAAIDEERKALQDLSDDIWSHPELNFEEHHAHMVLTDFLEKHGFPVERKYVLDTAFCSKVGSDEGPNVAVLCEYDALPEIGHACGHNLIAEAGIGAGVGVKAALDVAGKALGKLVLLGTPAEEGGGGKIDLLKAGVFDSLDVAMMVHPSGQTVADIGLNCFQEVTATFRGKASHASSAPWQGVNALDAAVMAYNSVSCLRQQMKPTWRVHGVFSNGGAKPNIIPEVAQLQYFARTPSVGELNELKTKMQDCFEGAARVAGCQVTIDWKDKYYMNLLSNATMAKLFQENGINAGVEFTQTTEKYKSSAGSDMGNVSHVVPSIHPLYYIGTDASNHSREYTTATGDPKAQPYTILQAKAMACTVLDIMYQPELLTQINEDFQQDLKHDQQK